MKPKYLLFSTKAFYIAIVSAAIFAGSVKGQGAGNDTHGVQPVPYGCNQFNNVRDFCISTDGKEAYFTIQSPLQEISRIAMIRKVNDIWQKPELMPFSDKWSDLEPFLTGDGLRLYFASDRPANERTDTIKDHDIWYVQRRSSEDQWSAPVNLGTPVNTDGDEFYPSLSSNNNLYFTLEDTDGMGMDDIYMCLWNGNSYETPQLLDSAINTSGYEYNAFISHDEQFIIFDRYNAPDGLGSGDLYISYKDKHGNWQPATNMGPVINSKYMDYCPFYDQGSEILYFTSRRSELAPMKFNDVSELKMATEVISNGQSRIYMVEFSPEAK